MNERLKAIRIKLGKTQRQMGALLKISYQAWQGYEKGPTKPGSEVLESLVKLGFNVNWILTGGGYMQANIEPAKEPAHLSSISDMQVAYRVCEAAETTPGIVVDPKAVIDAVNEVMSSDDVGTKLALAQNAFTFLKTVRNGKEIEELRRDMDIIKRRLMEPREDDFKIAETSEGKVNPGRGNGVS
jgi:transcriptional regulator with XRE-family HTH domain